MFTTCDNYITQYITRNSDIYYRWKFSPKV